VPLREYQKCRADGGGLEYPADDPEHSPVKDRVNVNVDDMFAAQGLGTIVMAATILILDSLNLRTTNALMARHSPYIKQIIIAENSQLRYEEIASKVKQSEWRGRVIVVLVPDVIRFLMEDTSLRVDFMWLDMMTNTIKIKDKFTEKLADVDLQLFAQTIKRLGLRCLAITLAVRSNTGCTVLKRTEVLAEHMYGSLLHKVCDWGYQSIPKKTQSTPKLTQPMQLIVFGRHYVACLYRIHTVKEVRTAQGSHEVCIEHYGYPDRFFIRPGAIEDWCERVGEGEYVE
jgi:hypothetical protein